MTDAALQFTVESRQVSAAALDFSKLAVSAATAEQATDSLTRASREADSATDQLADSINRELAQLRQLQGAGAAAGTATAQLTKQTLAAAAANDNLVRSQKVAQRAGLDLSRQLSDVGVSLAGGISPMMVLIQQGPQIADSLSVASAAGVGLRGVLAGLYAQIAPLAAALAPVALAVGAVAGGFALFHRELSKGYPKDITDGLGLTEEQLKRVESKTVTFGDTFMATFEVIGDRIMSGPVGKALGWLGDRFGEIMDVIGKAAVNGTANLIGVFVATYQTIVKHWRQFPQMMNALVAGWVNFGIENMERFVNVSIHGLNRVLEVMSKITGKKFEPFKDVTFGRASTAGNPAAETFNATREATAAAVRAALADFGQDVQAAAIARTRARAVEEAGDPRKARTRTARDPRDMTDERTAQVDQLLAQAKAEELRAQLDLTKDIKKRAELEKQVSAQQMAGRKAQIEKQIAAIWDDKGLSDAKKLELATTLEIVKGVQQRAANLQAQKIDEDAARALTQEAYALDVARLEAQATVLEGAANYARTEAERFKIVQQLRDIEAKIRRKKLDELVALAQTPADRDAAQAAKDAFEEGERLRGLNKAREQAEFAFNNTSNALSDVANGFKSQNWVQMAGGINEAVKTFQTQLGTAGGAIGALAAIANIAGGMIGGTGGSIISGAGSGAMAGMMLGGPIGAGIGAVLGGIGGLFGANKAKKQKRAQEAAAEARRVAQIAEAAERQQIELLRLRGEAEAALAREQELVLKGMDPSLHARQREIWALEAQAEEAAKLAAAEEELARVRDAQNKSIRDLQLQLMEMDDAVLGTTVARDARRADELALLSETEQYLQKLIWARQDEGELMQRQAEQAREAKAAADAAVNAARGDLQRAVDRQRSILDNLISKWGQVASSLADFGRSILDEIRGVGGSGQNSYAAARDEFRRLVALGPNADFEDLQRAGDAYRAASKNYQSDSLGYLSDLTEIYAAVDQAKKYAETQVSEAERQLEELKLQTDHLLNIEKGVLSIPAAISALQSAIAKATAANDNVSRSNRPDLAPGGLFEGYTREQLYSWQSLPDASPWALPAPMKAAWDTLQQLKSMGVNIPGFATGGSFQVGGSGGVDSQMVKLWASPKEYVSVSHTDPQAANDALVAEVRALRLEVTAMRRDTSDTAKNTRRTDDTLTRVTQGGDAMLTEAA